MASDRPACSRCHAAPSPIPVPPHRCPSCGTEAQDPARENRFHCRSCNKEFEDYEEWVRRCRHAAFAALRPPPPPIPEPPPRPARLKAAAVSLLIASGVYALLSIFLAGWPLILPGLALSLLQAVAGLGLLKEVKGSDRLARLAVGLSALLPLFVGLAVYYVFLFWYLCDPAVPKYFGGRSDPAPEGARHALIAWLAGLAALLFLLFAVIVDGALETARRWNDPLPGLLNAGMAVVGFFGEHRSWAPFGALAGLCVLAIWGKINQVGFFWATSLALIGLLALGGPPVVAAVFYERSAREAEALFSEQNVHTLISGLREPDPKKRIAAARTLEALGKSARSATPVLVQGIQDKDPRVRLCSAAAVARFDPSLEASLPVLIKALEDPTSSSDEVSLATRALSYLGPRARPAVPLLLEGLKHGDLGQQALVEIGIAAIPGLTDALKHKDAAVRRRAASVLARIGPAARSAVPAITDLVKDPDPLVRSAAVVALGEVHRDKAVPLLIALLREDKTVEDAAAQELCVLGEREGLSAIRHGGNFLNPLRRPVVWDHLSKTYLDKDLEGTGRELLVDLAERAATRVELEAECAEEGDGIQDSPSQRSLAAFRRVSVASRRRSVLEVLNSMDIDFVLESDGIRVMPSAQAADFWKDWLSETRKARK
jgi:HEAT repeat protein